MPKLLVRRTSKGDMIGKIIEVKAYCGSDDPTSYAYKGKTISKYLMN
ncbi:MAG: DNA-3-methyladenine glycosylase [archaeon]|nr:DNA-3-methyladenine glycosylase [archaeon]MCP8306719.1 DNA-3-methyladenine glycosylase [archaeon]